MNRWLYLCYNRLNVRYFHRYYMMDRHCRDEVSSDANLSHRLSKVPDSEVWHKSNR